MERITKTDDGIEDAPSDDDDEAVLAQEWTLVGEEASDAKVMDIDLTGVTLDDIPQAFSHFSYRYSNRSVLICDLQGFLDTSAEPARFRLTDPAIHYTNRRRTRRERTNKGRKGVRKFYQTHKCNKICKLLGLPDNDTKKKKR
jgi:hypothetical protein